MATFVYHRGTLREKCFIAAHYANDGMAPASPEAVHKKGPRRAVERPNPEIEISCL